jgi:feruloyl esterase
VGSGAGPPGATGSFDKMIADGYLGYLSLPLPQQDTSWNADTLRFDPASFTALLPMAAVYDASNPDLSALRDRGGKLILYHGWSDDSISPLGTIAYYAALQQQMGGQEATQRFARLFMFPGVYHCSGGYGPSHWDMVTPITDWVERGVAPTQIVATQYESDAEGAGGGFQNPTDVAAQGTSNSVVRTLPAFPYPLEPHYTGSGDVNDAQNYVPVQSAFTANDDFNWIGRSQISPAGSGSLPASGGPPLGPVLLLVGGSIGVLLLLLVAAGFVVLSRQRP